MTCARPLAARQLGVSASARALALGLSCLGCLALAQDPASPLTPAREEIEVASQELAGLKFEQALARLDAVLARPALAEAEVFAARALRSQLHVALGDLEKAEEDYRELLRLRPGYEPEASLTPRKALNRFRKVQGTMIGRLQLVLRPPDARVWVDGREVVMGASGELAVLAGERALRVERAGFDAHERSIRVEAGSRTETPVELIPNARTVIVVSEPEAVQVTVDGRLMGQTARTPQTGVEASPAELSIENLALGEHVIEFSKPCFRNERRSEMLVADLLEQGPRRIETVRMVPARAKLMLREGPPGAQVVIDGEPAGRLPIQALELCPGSRRLEVHSGGRLLWDSHLALDEGQERELVLAARPNLVLLAPEGRPPQLTELAQLFNVTSLSLPPEFDPTTVAAWDKLEALSEADLALAWLPRGGDDLHERLYLFSPILRLVHRLQALPVDLERPSWTGHGWGLFTADSALGGAALVVEVAPGSPAAAAGLKPAGRVVSIGGRPVKSTEEVRAALEAVPPGASVELRWTSPAGRAEQAELRASEAPRLWLQLGGADRAALRAAWAAADAVGDPERSDVALANLALLYSAFGLHEQAAASWKRVRFPERAGIGQGTAQYYLGRELEWLGREAEAAEAYRAAARSPATAHADEGPGISLAARDHLADLGIPFDEGASAR